MNTILEANHYTPYKLMKNHLGYKQQYRDLLEIAKKNQPYLNTPEIIEMFKELSRTGCSCAVLANTIAEQFYQSDEAFQKDFGFSLYIKGTPKIDYNKILVDIFSKLYKVFKAEFIEYPVYAFDSLQVAAECLLGIHYETSEEAMIHLLQNGILGMGVKDGKCLFQENPPKVSSMVGTCEEITYKKFGIEGITQIEDLKKICQEKKIELKCYGLKIPQKFSGLSFQNFNFWCAYYFQMHGFGNTLIKEDIPVSPYRNAYQAFQKDLMQLIQNGYSIYTVVTAGKEVHMHTKKPRSWGTISKENVGHIMNFRGFDENEDILVSTYGDTYTIPKEFFLRIEFYKVHKEKMEKTYDVEETHKIK